MLLICVHRIWVILHLSDNIRVIWWEQVQAVGFGTVDDQLDTLDLKPPPRPNT